MGALGKNNNIGFIIVYLLGNLEFALVPEVSLSTDFIVNLSGSPLGNQPSLDYFMPEQPDVIQTIST
jgi:hypothetical protein